MLVRRTKMKIRNRLKMKMIIDQIVLEYLIIFKESDKFIF